MRASFALLAAALLLTACTDDRPDDRLDDAAVESPAPAPPATEEMTPPAGDDDPADDGPADAPPAPRDDAEDDTDDADDDVAATIPARFHGEWNADLSACGTGSNESRLRISSNAIRFYESTGAVRAVAVESERVITVTAEYQGEGDTWRDTRRLALSEGGDRLTVTSQGSDFVRQRCP